ncbi:hypothetical protein EJ419_04820 [Alloscardovia theropitheci]|uniref:LPXTG cell wall anchor domain-containing protein n=1 Tax=Alloscardovia theropitheci TaxID=2496842 RepID=A0A4R0QVS1_9BIFI|nr:hypothetical protein [Alloscardovia theropitheci]TCD54357.1 hypothetical protein EJ419_04820 [Alloscardovia theropitheci]
MERLSSRFIAALTTLTMLFAGAIVLLTPQTARAADADLPIAQYVSTSGTKVCATNPESATYNGTVDIKVPMSKVLESHEADMQQAGASGLYPHGLEGRNRIAYISYDVTFPEDVTVGTITTANTVSYINGNRITHTVNGRTVNFRLYLNDVNWQTIYTSYLNDKANPDAHTVDLHIPYTAQVASYTDATRMDSENITGQGSFSFYASGMMAAFGIGATTYNSDVASVPFVSQTATCFTPPVQKVTQWLAEDGTVLKAQETGTDFAAQETFTDYDFVSETVSADGNTKTYTYKKKLQATDVIPEGEKHADLTADLLGSVDGRARDTQHTEVLTANSKSSVFSVTGTLHVNDLVQGQMGELINKYDESPQTFDNIVLSDMSFAFNAQLTLPEQMQFEAQGTYPQVTLEGANGFEVKNATVNGKTINVTIGLSNADQITNFAQLKTLIDGLHNDLSVTVGGIGFTAAAQAGTPYTITGRTSGAFAAQAMINNVARQFSYTYDAVQKADEADSTGATGLALTVQYARPVQQDLLADLRGAQDGRPMDTTHTQAYVADSKNSQLTLEGVLHVSDTIKQQMKAIEDRYAQNPSGFANISIAALNYGFTAKLTLPSGMEFGDTDITKLELQGAPGFAISHDPAETFYDGNELTVHFELVNPQNVTDYAHLSALVNGVDDDLIVRVPSVRFTADSQPSTNYTVRGTVSGNFNATATLGTHAIPFAFEWNGVQKADEADAVEPQGINFTVQYKPEAKPVPTKPQSNKPKKPALAKTGSQVATLGFIAALITAAGVAVMSIRKQRMK